MKFPLQPLKCTEETPIIVLLTDGDWQSKAEEYNPHV